MMLRTANTGDRARDWTDMGASQAASHGVGGVLAVPFTPSDIRSAQRERERRKKAAWTAAHRIDRNAYLRQWRASSPEYRERQKARKRELRLIARSS